MTFSVEGAIGDAVERLTTQAGAVLVLVLAAFGTLGTAAGQDIARGVVEFVLNELEGAPWRDDLTAEQLEALESVEAELEAAVAELPLALGLAFTLALLACAYVAATADDSADADAPRRDSPGEYSSRDDGW